MASELLTSPTISKAQWQSRLHGPPPGMSNLYFTSKWPNSGDGGWVSGKYLQIQQTVVVPYRKGYTLPSGAGLDFLMVDLHNVAGSPTSMYPATDRVVYEILIGLKRGMYQVTPFIPGNTNFLLALGYSQMFPTIANPDLKFLGAYTHKDTPDDSPLWKIWVVDNQDPWLLQIAVDQTVDFEKTILYFQVAKHRIAEIPKPDVFTTLRHYSEESGNW